LGVFALVGARSRKAAIIGLSSSFGVLAFTFAANAYRVSLAGAGLETAGLGLLFAWSTRRASRASLLGGLSVAFGAEIAVAHLFPPFWGPDFWGRIVGGLVVGWEIVVVVLAIHLALDLAPRGAGSSAAWLGTIAAVGLVGTIVDNVLWHATIGPWFDLPSTAGDLQGLALTEVAASTALAFVRRPGPGLAALDIALGTVIPASIANAFRYVAEGAYPTLAPLALLDFGLGAVMAVIAALAWFRALVRTGPSGRRLALLAWLSFFAFGIAGLLIPASLHDFGGFGVLNTIEALLLALAFFRFDLLDLPSIWASRRGALPLVALAALVIVAQVAQNFLAAQYGLLMGGVVAGALLFAANPLQRRFERDGGRASSKPRAGAEAAYRSTVRLALRGGDITRAEEEHLARVADELGLTLLVEEETITRGPHA
jgi:hypothetical protein